MSIGRNALFNFAGGALPAIVSLATIPLIVRGLGDEGYGLFALIVAIVGYFSLIDVNVTAGSVKYIAGYAATRDRRGIDQTVTFGLAAYTLIGVIGAICIVAAAPLLVREVFRVPSALIETGELCLRIAAFGFLFGQLQTYLNSVPQALLRYDLTSRVEMAFGTVVPLGTVALLALDFGLPEIIAFRVCASAVHCMTLWAIVSRLLPELRWAYPDRVLTRNLLRFTGYSFLSRVAAVTYAHADKLIIGAVVGVRALAYYTIAATLANRVLGLTFRLSSVLFPSASALDARGETDRLRALYLKATRYVSFINGSVLVLIAVFADAILYYWIGPEFAANGARILILIALAQFVDSLTNIPSLVNDGLGHPKVSGSMAFLRACLGLIAIYALVHLHGVEGAAWAHLATSALMTTVFVGFVHGRTVPCRLGDVLMNSYALPMAIILTVAFVTWSIAQSAQMTIAAVLGAMLFATGALFVLGVSSVLLPEDRGILFQHLRRMFVKRA